MSEQPRSARPLKNSPPTPHLQASSLWRTANMGSRPSFIDDLARAPSPSDGSLPSDIALDRDDALLDAYSRTVIHALERVQQAVVFVSVQRTLPGEPNRRGGSG